MNNFEEITKNPETLGAFLRACPSLKRRGTKNSSGSIAPGVGKSVVTMVALARMRTKRNNPLWWLSQESGKAAEV